MANDFVYFFLSLSLSLFVSPTLPFRLNNKSSGTTSVVGSDAFFAVFCLNARLQSHIECCVCVYVWERVSVFPLIHMLELFHSPHFTIGTSCFFAHFPLNDSIWWFAFFLYRMYTVYETQTLHLILWMPIAKLWNEKWTPTHFAKSLL